MDGLKHKRLGHVVRERGPLHGALIGTSRYTPVRDALQPTLRFQAGDLWHTCDGVLMRRSLLAPEARRLAYSDKQVSSHIDPKH